MFNFGLRVSLIQSPNKLIENASITKKIAGKKVIHHSPENKKSLPSLINVPNEGVVGGTPTPKKLKVDSAIIASASPIAVSYTHLTLPTILRV